MCLWMCVCFGSITSSWTEAKVSALYEGLIQSPLLLPAAVLGQKRQGRGDERQRGQTEKGATVTWQWQIALYLFKLCNVIFWLCCNVCFHSVWPCWWANTNELEKTRTQGERKTLRSLDTRVTGAYTPVTTNQKKTSHLASHPKPLWECDQCLFGMTLICDILYKL